MGNPSPSCIRTEGRLSVRRQCELLGVPRAKLYDKQKEPSLEECERIEKAMERIDYWHTTMPYLGARRLSRKLREDGIHAGRKLVQRLMEEMGIYAVYPKQNLSKRNFKDGIMPYLLKNKAVFLPNQVWSIDITYIQMHRSHMYLTAIIDWHSRMLVGWNLSDTLDTGYVLQAVRDAVEAHGIPAILNFDQGSQFTSGAYKALLRELHITQSMDGKSRWADNIMIERWFRSLKVEEIYPNEYNSPIEQYNTMRPHEALACETPKDVYDRYSASVSAGLDKLPLAG